MAQRRMFSDKIVDTDAFLDMGAGAQLLYFHLCMRADDDGFVSNPKKIMRMIGSPDDDYSMLLVKRFVIKFESGVCVIKHWLIHNLLRTDRYKETQYVKEKKMLVVDEETKKYSLIKPKEDEWQPNGNQMAPQVRLGKDSLTKERVLKNKKGEDISSVPASTYQPDGWSPTQVMAMKKRAARVLGTRKSDTWSQLLFGSAWDFKKAYTKFQGVDYVGEIFVDEMARTLAMWYEAGETRETVRELIVAFFTSEKSEKVTITPNSCFSAHTYQSWKQGVLKSKTKSNWWEN